MALTQNALQSAGYTIAERREQNRYKLMDYWSACFPQGSSNSFHEKLGGYMGSAYLLALCCIIIKLGVRKSRREESARFPDLGIYRQRDVT
ncbi:hypothetical protein TNCV_4637881 [Trichonephila clavipes]|uniref:Uncharacterized protein n=1 Tax=Trichonephila clavipes TaxID=2585209 RepID=A0A8X6WDQ9_TRICX|nr:hypothetical protein TNCV_4637881 [Trichonephila clavipes]